LRPEIAQCSRQSWKHPRLEARALSEMPHWDSRLPQTALRGTIPGWVKTYSGHIVRSRGTEKQMTDHLLRPAYAQRGNHLKDTQALGPGPRLSFALGFMHWSRLANQPGIMGA
jgi:hypothetical protein